MKAGKFTVFSTRSSGQSSIQTFRVWCHSFIRGLSIFSAKNFRAHSMSCFISYSFAQITAVSGLPAHPKDLQVSDSAFFVLACQEIRARHPQIFDQRKYLPFDIRESVFHGNQLDVTLSYSRRVQTERSNYAYTLPIVVVLEQERAGWQVLSCPLSRAIAENWSRDLIASAGR